jgi:hypothetical protein
LEVLVSDLEQSLGRLEALVAQAELRLRALNEENSRLRAALDADRPANAADHEAREGGTMRLAILEAERRDIRARIRGVLDTL